MARPLVAGAIVSFLVFARPASAQIHWDASAQVGVQRRFLANRPTDGEDAELGPTAMLNAHLALLPLLRIGAYVGHDISPMQGELSARDLTWGGVRAKVVSPWPRGTTRAYAFVGFGYDRTYARGTTTAFAYNGNPASNITRDGASGSFFEVPFGLGATYTFWKPWALVVELGMRVGFGFSGDAYRPPGPSYQLNALAGIRDLLDHGVPSGDDSFGIGLTVGILLDR